MRASHWQVAMLCGALGCGADGDGDGRSSGSSFMDAAQAPQVTKADARVFDPYCQTIRLPSDPVAPEILIVQDRSGSMVGLGDPRNAGRNRWQPSVRALKDITARLTDTVAFGLMLFPSPTLDATSVSVGGAGCTPGRVDVPVARDNADQIARVLDRSTPDVGATPTAASLMAAVAALDPASCAGCRAQSPRYVLLVTDGQPTCGIGGTTTTPEDITAATAAIDTLRAAGIKTYVIGYDTGSDPKAAAAMDGFALHGGTDKAMTVEDELSLVTELTRIAGALVPCEFQLNDDVDDASFVRVEIDGKSYAFGADWQLEGRTVRLTEQGGACTTLRDARLHQLKITRECAPVTLL